MNTFWCAYKMECESELTKLHHLEFLNVFLLYPLEKKLY